MLKKHRNKAKLENGNRKTRNNMLGKRNLQLKTGIETESEDLPLRLFRLPIRQLRQRSQHSCLNDRQTQF